MIPDNVKIALTAPLKLRYLDICCSFNYSVSDEPSNFVEVHNLFMSNLSKRNHMNVSITDLKTDNIDDGLICENA